MLQNCMYIFLLNSTLRFHEFWGKKYFKITLADLTYVYGFVFDQAGFAKALKMVGKEFLDTVEYFKEVWLPARTIVQTAIEKRFEVP